MAKGSAFEKIVVVTRHTRLEEIEVRFGTREQARFLFRQRAEHRALAAPRRTKPKDEFPAFLDEHETYREAVRRLLDDLDMGLKLQVIDRAIVPTFLFSPHDIIVTVGQDGLVANVAKYVGAQPIVAVNPDPKRIDGILLPFDASNARKAVERVLDGTATALEVTMAEATLDNGQRLRAFNDLFIGRQGHSSALYRIESPAGTETQSSSGVIVSTGVGSTGWLSSIQNMLRGFGAGDKASAPMTWDNPALAFVVREPFVSRTSQAGIVHGTVHPTQPLQIESMMPSGGVIFSDGVEADFLEFNAGTVVTIAPARQRARLVR